MGFLKMDYSEVNTEFEPLPVGDYECIVSSVEVTQSSTGKPMIKATLTVRDDIEQEGKKRKFFDNLVYQENMLWKFRQVGKAVGIPEGADLESLEQFAAEMQYKAVTIRNKHRIYNGETQDSVNAWKPSAYGDGQGDAGQLTVEDDDLPF